MRTPIETRAAQAFAALAPGDEDPSLADAKAPGTWLNYASAWRDFARFCEENAHQPLPAASATVKAYVRSMVAKRRAAATIEARVAAITTVHRLHGYHVDRMPLAEQFKAARRRTRQRRAKPLLAADLRSIVGALDLGNARDVRDGALLSIGFAAALRQSELSTLDYGRPGPWYAGGRGHLVELQQGLQVVLARSKTSQVESTTVVIPFADAPEAMRFLRRWVEIANVQPGDPLFRAFLGRGHGKLSTKRIAPNTVAAVIRRHTALQLEKAGLSALEASLQARAFSGHSLRRGYCTSAAQAGVAEWAIRQRSRHASAEQVAKYVGLAASWTDGSLKGVGV
jgi:integrase